MKHIKNYTAVKKKMKEYFALQYRKAKHTCEVFDRCFGNPKCLDKESGRELYRIDEATSWMTPGHQIDAGNVKRSHEYLEKDLPKWERHWTERLEAADKAGKLVEILISINWTRSRVWGSNPHAECRVYFEDTEYGGTRGAYSEGRASGYGYDKRSASVQEAFGFSLPKKRRLAACEKDLVLARASLDRFVIEHGEELWKEYAIDKTPVPHFCISGKGMSTFTGLFRRIGYNYNANNFPVKDYLIDYLETDRGSDVYHVIRKDRV